MTEFKITPEDVGRVAVDKYGTKWTCFDVTEGETSNGGAVWKSENGCHLLTGLDGDAKHLGTVSLYHWKPRTLVARKRWWNVYVWPEGLLAAGDVYSHEHGSFDAAVEHEINTYGDSPIARIYAEHWHGCEEGRFDTPESIEGEEL